MRGIKLGLRLLSGLLSGACAGSGAPAAPIGVTRGPVLRPHASLATPRPESTGSCQVPAAVKDALQWPDVVTLVSLGHPVPGAPLTSSVRVDPDEGLRYRHWTRGMTWSSGAPLVQFAWAAPGDWAFALVLEKRTAHEEETSGAPASEPWQAAMIDRNGCAIAPEQAHLCLECHRGAASDSVFGASPAVPVLGRRPRD